MEQQISLALTDQALTANLSPHFVINPRSWSAAKDRLLVMLTGAGGMPRVDRDVVRTGAAQGYHGISASPPHGAPVVDSVTPRDANRDPVFRPVWIYMAFP